MPPRQGWRGAGKKSIVAVCLAGLRPAVVSETLYALSVERRPRIVPHRVCIVTTAEAYPAVTGALLGRQGAIARLRGDYGLPARSLTCSPDDVFLLRDGNGRPLEDIRTSTDSHDAGESIARLLRNLRAGDVRELHCSLAGGRKTAGALLALALQLCGKPGDRLYHVLVNTPFEDIPEFFYPPPKPQRYLHDGRKVDSRRARVELAEIPFFRLGSLVEGLGLEAGALERQVAVVQESLSLRRGTPRFVVDLAARTIGYGRASRHAPPQQLALVALYARLRASCIRCRRTKSRGCAACHPTDIELGERHRHELADLYHSVRRGGGDRLLKLLCQPMSSAADASEMSAWLRQTRSRANRLLRSLWMDTRQGPGCCLVARREGDERRRGFRLSPERILIRGVSR